MPFLKKITTDDPDEELVRKYKAGGDMEVLASLYQRYMELVYGVCLKYLKDTEEAKDCVLIIFEELVTKLARHEVANFRAWLYQVAKNHCLMKLRKQKNRSVNMDQTLMHSSENIHPDEEMFTADPFEEKEKAFDKMRYCLDRLNAQQRQAIELFYFNNKCYREIAGITQQEVETVRSFIQNGRRNLKICMDKKNMQE